MAGRIRIRHHRQLAAFRRCRLCQSASFAAIAQLNDTHEGRSGATGAIAQLGNVGTTSGTPIMAMLIASYGINGLAAFVFVLSIGGVAMHAWLKMRRNAG